MTTAFASVFFAVGIAAWVYNKASHSTGRSGGPALVMAAVVGVIAFIVFFTVLRVFLKQ